MNGSYHNPFVGPIMPGIKIFSKRKTKLEFYLGTRQVRSMVAIRFSAHTVLSLWGPCYI